MAKELTGCGKFVVWVVPTAIAAVLGYSVIGPRIGGSGIGDKVPVIRSLGQELAKKVKGSDEAGRTKRTAPAQNANPSATTTPPPTSDGATEFQRIREEERAQNPPRNRRAPVDAIE